MEKIRRQSVARAWSLAPRKAPLVASIAIILFALSCDAQEPNTRTSNLHKAAETEETGSEAASDLDSSDGEATIETIDINTAQESNATKGRPNPESSEDRRLAEGAKLYSTHCQSCHGDILTTDKRLSTEEAIAASIVEDQTMRVIPTLKKLSDENISLIAYALGVKADEGSGLEQAGLTMPVGSPLGNRHFVASRLKLLFTNSERAESTDLAKIIDENIREKTVFFGGPCNDKSLKATCPGDHEANSRALAMPIASPARSGYLMKTCKEILSNNAGVEIALGNIGLNPNESASETDIQKLFQTFVRSVPPTQQVLSIYQDLYQAGSDSAANNLDGWRAVLLGLCYELDEPLSVASEDPGGDRSAVDTFDVCLRQLTQYDFGNSQPLVNDLRKAVVEGNKSPADACLEVLELADLTGQQRASDNPVARRVLSNMHDLHASWFLEKQFPRMRARPTYGGTLAKLDPEQPALYYTLALLDSSRPFNWILTGRDTPSAIRTDMAPDVAKTAGVVSRQGHPANVIFNPGNFAPEGDLLGASVASSAPANYSYTLMEGGGEKTFSGTMDFAEHFGGGIIGSMAYLMLTVRRSVNFVADGAVQMPRLWARSVYKDLLCRDLPVVRVEDIQPFLLEESEAPFRVTPTCTRCHASADRLAANIRGIGYYEYPGNYRATPVNGAILHKMLSVDPNLEAEPAWPASSDSKYSKRPPNGVLFYRGHAGRLVDIQTRGLGELGSALAKLPAPYICLAKRYYRYFVGVDVDVGDINDPSRSTSLSETDIRHRDFVIDLGMKLKIHQNPKATIHEILDSPLYRETAAGFKH